MTNKVTIDGDFIVFDIPRYLNHLAKSCGARWNPRKGRWEAKISKITASAVTSNFSPDEYPVDEIKKIVGGSVDIPPMTIHPNSVLRGVTLKPRQLEGIEKAWPMPGFAFFWVMGAGKTLSTISLAGLRYAHGLINKVVIICPTSVIGVWIKEYGRYAGVPYDIQPVISGKKLKNWTPDTKHVLVVGIEALSQGGAFDIAMDFVSTGNTLTVIDESSLIKNYDKNRTKNCIKIGENSNYRLILTGTNVTQGLQDLYSQMYFVDPAAIGEISFFSFRNKYCVMGGFELRKIVGYANSDMLFSKIRPYCDVVKKVEGLPDRSFQVREVVASRDQIQACKDLIKEMKAELEGKEISTKNVLEACLRLQQIVGGHLPDGTRLSKIPKLTELMNIIDEYDGKIIIWARFLPEIKLIMDTINSQYKNSAIAIYGEIPAENRQNLVDKFQSDPNIKYVVANQATARMGLTMTAAWLSIYYSNTFSLEDRLQSERRNHRIGQDHRVNYIDIMSNISIDRKIITAIEYKREVAAYATDELARDELVDLNCRDLEELL